MQSNIGYDRAGQDFTRRRYPYQRPPNLELRAPPAPTYNPPKRNVELLGSRRTQIIPQRSARTVSRVKNVKAVSKPQYVSPVKAQKMQKLVETRPVVKIPKPSPRKGPGLLTDSLSCIFTRRNNQQRKLPQKRVFYEEVPQVKADEVQKEKEDEVSDTESTYFTENPPMLPPATPLRDCPEPPRISQPTPDIKTEDWFTTKQRILGNVKHEITQGICDPLPETKCPEPPSHVKVDPHGFDIEPPTHLHKSVSPYVPSISHEREEYEKYKSEKLKKQATLALLQKRYEAERQQEDDRTYREERMASQPQAVPDYRQPEYHNTGNEGYNETYATAQKYENEEAGEQDLEKYHIERETYELSVGTQYYQEPSYEPASVNEQVQEYMNAPLTYHRESEEYFEQYAHYDQDRNNEPDQNNYTARHFGSDSTTEVNNDICPDAPHISTMPQNASHNNYENIPPEAPIISEENYENTSQYYQEEKYEQYAKYDETNTFKEPLPQPVVASNQTMCHKCSFQTTNPKKLRDHLKFVHGEVTPADQSNELFSRRNPKATENQEELFSRRGDLPAQQADKKNPPEVKFKRRNTSAVVNVISSDIIVPAKTATDNKTDMEESDFRNQETGVAAAMEYFESTKDLPKKPRPYKRNPEDMDKDWI